MPALITLDQQRGIRITTAMGAMRWIDFLEIYHTIVADRSLATLTRTLVDLRRASLDGVTRADVQAAANLPRVPRHAATRLAIVATSPFVYAMSRMYVLLQEAIRPGEVEVFSTVDAAMAWLVDPSPQ
jgi:hypothetical protein